MGDERLEQQIDPTSRQDGAEIEDIRSVDALAARSFDHRCPRRRREDSFVDREWQHVDALRRYSVPLLDLLRDRSRQGEDAARPPRRAAGQQSSPPQLAPSELLGQNLEREIVERHQRRARQARWQAVRGPQEDVEPGAREPARQRSPLPQHRRATALAGEREHEPWIGPQRMLEARALEEEVDLAVEVGARKTGEQTLDVASHTGALALHLRRLVFRDARAEHPRRRRSE